MQDEENAQAAWQWEHDAFGQLVRAGVGANILFHSVYRQLSIVK